LVALAGWRTRTLTAPGALAAWTVGMAVLYGTGWQGGAVLAAFFISSSLISRVATTPPLMDPKGHQRDHWQVFANGAVAAAGAAVAAIEPDLRLWLVTASLAAAASDTWATSVGSRSPVSPRLIWNQRVVPAGSNGGITLLGTVGAVGGAMIVAGTAAIAAGRPMLLPVGTLIGFFGMLVDSTLGALLQGRFHCPSCQVPSEWTIHRCGSATVQEGGLAWLNNDGVNFLATLVAAAAAWATWQWMDSPG
jgi:uncharacterized protein (TIGR00297 family)